MTRSFIEARASVAELLKYAEPEEQRIILCHYVEVLELHAQVGKKAGCYVLRLFPEATAIVGSPTDAPGQRNGTGEVPTGPRPQNPGEDRT